MKRFLPLVVTAAVLFAGAANAQGHGDDLEFKFALVTNHVNDSVDPFRSDQHDEYLTGAGFTSLFLSTSFGVLEAQHAFQLYTPAAPFQWKGKWKDRLYAGVMNYSFAVHNDWGNGLQTRFALGLDVTGPQTGLDGMQTNLHEWLGLHTPHWRVLRNQVGDASYFSAQAEVGYPIEFGISTLRPFGEVRIGHEQFARVGMDVFFGGAPLVLSREYGSGLLMSPRAPRGWSASIGTDYTHIFGSALFPDRSPVEMIPDVFRLRGAVTWQGEHMSVQFGMAAISANFVGQRVREDSWPRGFHNVAFLSIGTVW